MLSGLLPELEINQQYGKRLKIRHVVIEQVKYDHTTFQTEPHQIPPIVHRFTYCPIAYNRYYRNGIAFSYFRTTERPVRIFNTIEETINHITVIIEYQHGFFFDSLIIQKSKNIIK